jgi:regulator of sigma E protease
LEPSSENIQPADANRNLTPSSPPPSDPTEPPADTAEQEQPSFRLWLLRNLLAMVAMTVLVSFIAIKYGPGDLAKWILVGLGLGVVILVHELGHFLVAKWCDVYVETFSIGFGPAFPGCQYKKGETTYKIAMFPLGGYVKMLGENPEDDPDGEDNPRSFKNKSVPQRMAIISAGVIMNVILGCLAFMFVYRIHGDEQVTASISAVDCGSPAWMKGAKNGDIIWQIANVENPSFEDLKSKVPLSAKEDIIFVIGQPHGPRVNTTIQPRRNPGEDMAVIGIIPGPALELAPGKKRSDDDKPVAPHSPAARAMPAFEFGDRIVAMTDPKDPTQITPLPANKHNEQSKLPDYFAFQERMERLADREVVIRVQRTDAEGKESTADIRVPPGYHTTLGLRMKMGRVVAVRELPGAPPSPVQYMGQVINGETLSGDIIKAVEVTQQDGTRVRWALNPKQPAAEGVVEKDLDPLLLPRELRKWADGTSGQRKVKLTVGRTVNKEADRDKDLELTWDDSFRNAVEIPLSLESPLSIPELGIAYQVGTTVEGVAHGSPAEKAHASIVPESAAAAAPWYLNPWAMVLAATLVVLGVVAARMKDWSRRLAVGALAGVAAAFCVAQLFHSEPTPEKVSKDFQLQKGDVITEAHFYRPTKDGKTEPTKEAIKLKDHQWAWIAYRLDAVEAKKLGLKVERGGSQKPEVFDVVVEATEDKDWPKADRGLSLIADTRLKKADTLVEAVGMGFDKTYKFIAMVYNMIHALATRSISPNAIGGPIMIFKAGFDILAYDPYKFIFFLGMISINLAVINFLPIPVLDGGHFVFLLYEGIFRKPAPEKVRVAMTYVGLLLLVGLMLFVIVLDLKRYVF